MLVLNEPRFQHAFDPIHDEIDRFFFCVPPWIENKNMRQRKHESHTLSLSRRRKRKELRFLFSFWSSRERERERALLWILIGTRHLAREEQGTRDDAKQKTHECFFFYRAFVRYGSEHVSFRNVRVRRRRCDRKKQRRKERECVHLDIHMEVALEESRSFCASSIIPFHRIRKVKKKERRIRKRVGKRIVLFFLKGS